VRSTTKIDSKNSLYPLSHFTEHLLVVFSKLPRERFRLENLKSFDLETQESHRLPPCNDSHTLQLRIKQKSNHTANTQTGATPRTGLSTDKLVASARDIPDGTNTHTKGRVLDSVIDQWCAHPITRDGRKPISGREKGNQARGGKSFWCVIDAQPKK
jgi:hypothetical protein